MSLGEKRRPEGWADLKYDAQQPGVEQVAHIVVYGDFRTLCNLSAVGFHGTGSFEEHERVHQLPTCSVCTSDAVTSAPSVGEDWLDEEWADW